VYGNCVLLGYYAVSNSPEERSSQKSLKSRNTVYWLSYCLIFKSYEDSKFSKLILLGKLKIWESGNSKNRKVIPVHIMKAYRWSSSVPPHILNVGTKWCWMVGFTSLPVYPRCPLSRMMCGPHRLSVCFGEEKNSCVSGIETWTSRPWRRYVTLAQFCKILMLVCHISNFSIFERCSSFLS